MQRRLIATAIAFFLFLAYSLPSVAPTTNPLVVLSYSSYTDSLGYFHLVGEVQNSGSDPLDQVTVTANLSNATLEDYIMISILLPQQKSPFDLLEETSGTVSQVNVSGEVSSSLPYQNFQVANPSGSLNPAGIYHVVGQVSNTGTSHAYGVEVVATFYDANGVAVQAGSSITTPSNLPAGGSGNFDVSSDDPTMSARITTYSLQVQSASPVLPIPEYSTITPILAIAAIVVLVVCRRRSKPLPS